MDGAVLDGGRHGGTYALTGAVNADTLPAASRARTWNWVTPPFSELLNDVPVGVPTRAKELLPPDR